MFSNVLALKNTPKILKIGVRCGPKSVFFSVFFLDRFFLIFCSRLGSILAPLGAPGATFLGQNGVREIDGKQFFFKSAFGGPPLGAQSDPKGRPRTAQGRPKVTFWSLLDNFGSLFGGF